MTAVVTHEIGAARLATSNYLQYAVCHHDPSCLVVDADGGVSWVRVDVARRSAHVVRRIHPSSEAACVVAMALSESLYAAVADSTRAITVYDAAVDGHRVPFVSLLADASVVSMAFTSDPHLIVLTRTSLSVYDVMDRASNVKRVPGVTAFSYCPTSGLVYRTRDHVFVDDPTPTTVRVPMGASGARLVARIGPDRLVVVENQQPRLPASLVDGCFPTDQSPMDHLTNVVSDAAAVPPSSRVIVTDYAGNDNTCERFDDEFASIDMAAYDTKDGLLAVASFTASKVHVVRVVGDSLARTWNHDFSDGARVRGLSWHRDPARDAVFLFVLVVRPGGHPAPVFQPRYLSGPSSLTVFEHRVGPAIDRAPSPSSPVLDKLQEVLDAIADLKMQIVPEIAAIQSRLNTLEQRFRYYGESHRRVPSCDRHSLMYKCSGVHGGSTVTVTGYGFASERRTSV